MTQGWTDNPLTGGRPTRKQHIYDFLYATQERIKCLRTNSKTASYPSDPPTMYYRYITDYWGATLPDTRKFNDENKPISGDLGLGTIEQARGLLLPTQGTGTTGFRVYGTVNSVLKYHIRDDGKYLLYDNSSANNSVDQLFADTGLSNWTTQQTHGVSNPSYPINKMQISQINELRLCFEQCVWQARIPVKYYRTKGTVTGVSDQKATAGAAWTDIKAKWAAASWGRWIESTSSHLWANSSLTRVDSTHYYGTLTGYEAKIAVDLDFEIADMDWNIMPPLSAYLVIRNLDPQYFTDQADFWIKCSTTGDIQNVGYNNTDGRAYLLNSDITSYCGTGNNSVEFVFTSQDDFSSDDWDKLRPPDPTSDGQTVNKRQKIAVRYTLDGTDSGAGVETGYFAYVIIKPNWRYGAPDES